jgi:hypothetical protein
MRFECWPGVIGYTCVCECARGSRTASSVQMNFERVEAEVVVSRELENIPRRVLVWAG